MGSCVNPFVYATTIPAFKEFIKGVFRCESSTKLDDRVNKAMLRRTESANADGKAQTKNTSLGES